MRMRYVGLIDPDATMLEFSPYRSRLAEVRGRFSPASNEYRALLSAEMALREAADVITGKPNFLFKPAGDFAYLDRGIKDAHGRK